jgi:hypothetical protein
MEKEEGYSLGKDNLVRERKDGSRKSKERKQLFVIYINNSKLRSKVFIKKTTNVTKYFNF